MTAGREKPPPLATDARSVGRDIAAGLRRGAHTVYSPAALRYVFAGDAPPPPPALAADPRLSTRPGPGARLRAATSYAPTG